MTVRLWRPPDGVTDSKIFEFSNRRSLLNGIKPPRTNRRFEYEFRSFTGGLLESVVATKSPVANTHQRQIEKEHKLDKGEREKERENKEDMAMNEQLDFH